MQKFDTNNFLAVIGLQVFLSSANKTKYNREMNEMLHSPLPEERWHRNH